MSSESSTPVPLVVALDMGYGHLRAAQALADAFGTEVHEADRPPLAREDEQGLWRRARLLYEGATRGLSLPLVGPAVGLVLEALTRIAPLHPYRDLSRPDRQTRVLSGLLARGLGSGVAAHLNESGRPLVATYFTPALAADRLGCKGLHLVVTDADLARAWVPLEPAATGITYLAPSRRAVRRLRAYGVPAERIRFTGFPLPLELLGGPDLSVLRSNLAARLVRLDPTGVWREPRVNEIERVLGPLPSGEEGRPPLLAFAVGGTGSQAEIARRFLPSLRAPIEAGRLRLALIAGVRSEVAERFHEWLRHAGLEPALGSGVGMGVGSGVGPAVEVLHEPDFLAYYRRLNALLAHVDVLWTKPSEMTFYGALGLALVLGRPVGVHETENRRWARERGAALKQRDPSHASQWLAEWLEEGLLAAAAWSGFLQLPASGTHRILELLGRPAGARAHAEIEAAP